jgi:hypothetical protein
MAALLRRLRFTAVLEPAAALVAVLVLISPGGTRSGTARVELSRAAGTLSLADSRNGAAIFQAANMRPGQQTSGSVRVTDTGTLPATLTLALDGLVAADPASRMLSSRLQLLVADVTDASRPSTVYRGALAAMPALGLGALPAGRGRDFLFVASLPAGTPAADNPLQGAMLSADFRWTATATTPGPTPTPSPQPTPTPTPTPTATPPPPGGTTCAPRRLRIRIRAHGRRILRATVRIGHGRRHRVKVRHGRIRVKVTGAKPARVTVRVALAGGRRLVIHRRVRGC